MGIQGAGRRPEAAGPGHGEDGVRQRTGPHWDGIVQGLVGSQLRSVTFCPRVKRSQRRPLRRGQDWRQRDTAGLALQRACWLRSGECTGGRFQEARAAMRGETIPECGWRRWRQTGRLEGCVGGRRGKPWWRRDVCVDGAEGGGGVKSGGNPRVCFWMFLVGKCLAFGRVHRFGMFLCTCRHSLLVVCLSTAPDLSLPACILTLHPPPPSACSLYTQLVPADPLRRFSSGKRFFNSQPFACASTTSPKSSLSRPLCLR